MPDLEVQFAQPVTPLSMLLENLDVNGFYIISQNNGDIIVLPNGSGKVGIGDPSPSAFCSVKGSFYLSDVTNGSLLALAGKSGTSSNYNIDNRNGDYLTIQSTAVGSVPLTLAGSGSVGIGTLAPDRLLHVTHPTTEAIIRLENLDNTLTSGDVVGGIEFEGNDASGGPGVSAKILAVAVDSFGQTEIQFHVGSGGYTTKTFVVDGYNSIVLTQDYGAVYFGAGTDYSMYYDGSYFQIKPSVDASGGIVINKNSFAFSTPWTNGEALTAVRRFTASVSSPRAVSIGAEWASAANDSTNSYVGCNSFVATNNTGDLTFADPAGAIGLRGLVLNGNNGCIITWAVGVAGLSVVQDGRTGTITNAVGLMADAIGAYDGTITSGFGLYVRAMKKDAGGTFTNANSIWLEKQTIGASNNRGIVLDGDGAGSDLLFGADQDASIQFNGSGLAIRSDLVTATDYLNLRGGTNGITFNIGATEYVTLTSTTLAVTPTLQTSGRALDVVTKTTGYTATVNEDVIVADSTSAFNIALPAATGSGRRFIVTNKNTGEVTLVPDGSDKINGESAVTLEQYDAAQLVDVASNQWMIV